LSNFNVRAINLDKIHNLYRIDRIMGAIILKWRSIGIDTITDQSLAENESRASERAMIAAAKKIIDEKMAKEVIRPHEPRTKCAEKESADLTAMRRELAPIWRI
jgi:hypothetical protein